MSSYSSFQDLQLLFSQDFYIAKADSTATNDLVYRLLLPVSFVVVPPFSETG